MALTKQTPEEIKAQLKVKAQGVENTLALTYHNRSNEEYDQFAKNPELIKLPEDVAGDQVIAHMNTQLVLFVVKSFDDGTDKDFPLDYDGLMALEAHWPGMLYGILKGFHQARGASVEKN